MSYTSMETAILNLMNIMFYVSLSFSLLIFFLAILRRYNEFGEQLGIKFVFSMMAVFLLICFFPSIAGYLFASMIEWGRVQSKELDQIFTSLQGCMFVGQGGWMDWNESIVFGIFNPVYKGMVLGGYYLKQVMTILFCGLFLVFKILSPIFLASLLVPEMKSMGTNMLSTTLGLIMMPLCFLFGDMIVAWAMSYAWTANGISAAFGTAAGAGGAVAAASLLAVSASPVIVLAGVAALGALGGFLGLMFVLCMILYVGVPLAVLSFFKGGGVGNAMAIGLGAGSNVGSMAKPGMGMGSGMGGKVGGMMGGGGTQSISAAVKSLGEAAKTLTRKK